MQFADLGLPGAQRMDDDRLSTIGTRKAVRLHAMPELTVATRPQPRVEGADAAEYPPPDAQIDGR